jgi:Sec-independent protein secretion pathway component TatC
MYIGWVELILLVVVAVPILLVGVLTRHRWVLGVIGCVAVAVVATPPDVMTTLLLALPLSAVYVVAALVWLAWRKRRTP